MVYLAVSSDWEVAERPCTPKKSVQSFRFLHGPNLYARQPVMVAILAIGSYEDKPSTFFPGFTERLTAWLPDLQEHRCSIGRPGGFIERLRSGTYLGHITEHVALELVGMIGLPAFFGRTRGTGELGVYRVVIACSEDALARPTFDAALEMVLAAMNDQPFDVAGRLKRLQALAGEVRLGPSTAAIAEAARARDIPVLRLTPAGNLLQLGWGVYQKRIQAAETGLTSSLAVSICQEKPLTNLMLRDAGVPVPDGETVRTARGAWSAARRLGLPVVVKPADGNQGNGVSANLTSRTALMAAFAEARKHSRNILVERYIEGDDFRLLVVKGKMVAAARRDPPVVVGDGVQTVKELAERLNEDPRRGEGHGSPMTRVPFSGATGLTLRQQGLAWLSVPEHGQIVRLRQNCNLSTGGVATDVTDYVHPGNARLAELASRVVGLDIAGVDVVCQDISRPLQEQGGAVIEVNASPGLRMHVFPAQGQSRPVADAIVEMLYPQDSPSRVPVIAVTGTNGKTSVVRLISYMYELAGKTAGMTSTEGTFVASERILEGDCSGPRSARSVLSHPNVEVAVLETARGGILRDGLGFDACNVAVVTGVAGDHLGLEGVNSLEDLSRVKQVIVQSVRADGAAVLNADDPLVAGMAEASPGRVVYFSLDPYNPLIASHLAAGGDAVFIDNGAIILASGESRTELLPLAKLRFAFGGKVRFMVQNALASVAAAWAAGLDPALIASALTSFQNGPLSLPGRFNIINLDSVEVLVDYAHNAAALTALSQAMEALGKRRTHMVIGLPGDRRDEDLVEAISATTSYVDSYIVREDSDRRGRARREIFNLVKKSLGKEAPVAYISDELAAIAKALELARPGERVIIIVDKVHHALGVLEALATSAPKRRDSLRVLPRTDRPVQPKAVLRASPDATVRSRTLLRASSRA